jgi:signal transduction histidine kinase
MHKAVRILLIEDCKLDAELALAQLAQAGIDHETEIVEDREAFASAITEFSPDLVLADYSLPSFTGGEALELAKQLCPDVPFLFVSGVMGEEIAIESLKLGATDYVLKRRLERLGPAVKRAIDERRQRIEHRKAQEELNRRVRELTVLNADLEQFAYAASHDLQEPLRTISLYSKLLAKSHRGVLDKEADQYLDFIESSAHHMSKLLEDLLIYAKLPMHLRDVEMVDLNAVLDETLILCQATISESKATVTRDELPTVKGKAMHLSLVIQNLLSNALKYRSAKTPMVHVGAGRGTESWLISVKDNGIGFDQSHADQVFGLFKRLDRNATPGSGLGLAICKRVVETHGGRIWAESRPNVGTTFYFSIPFQESDTDSTKSGAAVDNRAKAHAL